MKQGIILAALFISISVGASLAFAVTPPCIPRPACLDSNPRCMIAEPVNGWCPSISITPVVQPPLMCTGTSCLRNNQTGMYQCSMQPVSMEVIGSSTVQYEGYCTNITKPSQNIPLVPILTGSSTFQPIFLHPGSYSCVFRYCITTKDGNKQCIRWGQGGPLEPLPTPIQKQTPRPIPTLIQYECPTNPWINCMPTVDGPVNQQCNQAYLSWAKINCPNFQGAAY